MPERTSTNLKPGLRWVLVAILGASLVLNVVSLLIPFSEVRAGSRHTAFTLMRTATLLWNKGFHILSALAIGFSVCFPFVKLGILGSIVAGWGSDAFRTRSLRLVAALGKWSLLDIYVVSLLAALIHDRLFIGGTPSAGATAFMIAIVLSMFASELMEGAILGSPAPPATRGLARPWLVMILVGHVVASVVLVAALLIPALWINDWRLVDGPVSIIDAVPNLWQGGTWALAIAVGAFLVAAPLAVQGLELAGTAALVLGASWKRVPRWSRIVQRWSMLDVFGLAFLLFLTEGHRLIRTDLGLGTTALAITIAFYLPVVAVTRWLLGKAGRAVGMNQLPAAPDASHPAGPQQPAES